MFVVLAILAAVFSPAMAQSRTPTMEELQLKYQIGQMMSAQAQSDAQTLQVQAQRDWWIACDNKCREWALGEKK